MSNTSGAALLVLSAIALAGTTADPAAAKRTRPIVEAVTAPKTFVFDVATNAEIAKKLKVPVFFAVPSSTWLELPKDIKTTDKLVEFHHPEAKNGDVGYRIVVTKRSGMSGRLAKSGLVQTGDILLTFRPEWGGGGAYPNVQMGISHAGIAYVKNGEVHNIDNPLDAEYLGRDSKLSSAHYKTLNYLHVIRPRDLSAEERANIEAWASRLTANQKKVYPAQLAFNKDYNAPKFRRGDNPAFVQKLGQIGLNQNPGGTIDLYCSEFAWSLLSLRRCDPAKSGDAFQSSRMPSCVREPMKPLPATGTVLTGGGHWAQPGLVDGPLLVVESMKLPNAEEQSILKTVFVENPDSKGRMSQGHRDVATAMQPKFAPLEKYYAGMSGGGLLQNLKARMISKAFRDAIPDNYSPTSFLINTLLPASAANRTMDYVATIMIE